MVAYRLLIFTLQYIAIILTPGGTESVQGRPISTNEPQIVITSFRVLNHLTPILKDETGSDHATLSYQDYFFSFEFSPKNFTQSLRTNYEYTMEGLDSIWIPLGTRRYVSYTHLDPGEYVFKVRCMETDSTTAVKDAAVRITILPPYWERWWFRAVIFMIVCGLVWSSFQYRIKKLMEIEQMRMRIAADLHDEIGSNLSSITIASQMLEHQFLLDEAVQGQLHVIQKIALQTAETMRDIVWLINPENDKLDDLILRMKDIASAMFAEISYEFSGPEMALSERISLEFKRNLFLIFKEALTNIIRHSAAKHVWIRLTIDKQIFHLAIIDDGIGFLPASNERGNGLSNMRRRAAYLRARFTITSALGRGTTIELAATIT